jgi:hypothetical protein
MSASQDAAELPPTVRVFVDERAVEVPRGATALDAVRAHDPAAAAAVAAGDRVVTDSRGLPTDAAGPTHAGAIYRIIPARRRADAGAEPE